MSQDGSSLYVIQCNSVKSNNNNAKNNNHSFYQMTHRELEHAPCLVFELRK